MTLHLEPQGILLLTLLRSNFSHDFGDQQPGHKTLPSVHLERQSLAGGSLDGSLDAAGAELGVRVGDRLQSSGGGRVGAAAEVDVADDGVAGLVAVGTLDGLGGAGLEDAALDQELSTLASVDAAVAKRVVVVAVADVSPNPGTRACERGSTYLKMWPVPNRKDGVRLLMLFQ